MAENLQTIHLSKQIKKNLRKLEKSQKDRHFSVTH